MSGQQLPEKAIVIGASAGALNALTFLFQSIPEDYPYPFMVVVHIPANKDSLLSELLQDRSKIKITEAVDKEYIQPGQAYIAPPDYHLLVEKNYTLALSSEPPVHFSRPAIDVLFETAADAYSENLTAVVLTGANQDGAAGAKIVEQFGGRVIIQDPDTAEVSVMPEAAAKACKNPHILTLENIQKYILEL